MVGYGPEDSSFVVELTYNYGVKHYRKGNDFQVQLERQSFVLTHAVVNRARLHLMVISQNAV